MEELKNRIKKLEENQKMTIVHFFPEIKWLIEKSKKSMTILAFVELIHIVFTLYLLFDLKEF